jgi:DNA helicase II / ATP-dependent DNA helicase PcrA
MMKLSLAQSEIVKAPIGQPVQVLASAGSGKTRVLTERVRYIVANTKKDGVIALTFTNKAAEEMQDRLHDLEGVDDRCWISTIHAVAQRVLDQYGHSIGLPSELHIYERDLDRKTVFLQSLRENGVDIDAFLNVTDDRTKKDRERIIQNYMEQFSIVKRELLNETEIATRYPNDENFLSIYQAYQSALLDSGGIDFDDILVFAHRIIMEQPWCAQIYRARYKHICVDEAQDLNKAQYEFIKVLCGDSIHSLMMVGDPNQMIYGFNGSSYEFLCQQFVADFKPICFQLKENYRSSKAVIYFANLLRPGSQIELDYALDGYSQIVPFPGEKAESEWICNQIEALVQLGKHDDIEGVISLSNIVVIARNRFVFLELERQLSQRGIHYSLKKGERRVEPTSVLGKILDLAIRLKINPKDWVDGKKLCNILKLQAPDSWGEENMLENFADNVRLSNMPFPDLQADLLLEIHGLKTEQPNVPKLCSDFMKQIETMGRTSPDVDGELERSLQELKEFRGCWTTFRRKGLGESLSSFRNAMALGQLSDDYDPSGLTLSTVHTMKGLEKDIVFLMGMCEGVFPDYRANTLKEIDEERNNAFVAVTRSRRWIYITYPLQRVMPWGAAKTQAPSRFIRELTS